MSGNFSGNRIDIPTWTNLSPGSVTFWFKLNSPLKALERLVGSDDLWEIRVTQDWSAGSYRIANELFASSTSTPPAFSTTVVVADTWYFVAATATLGGSGLLYVNGVLESTRPCLDTPTSTNFSIGGRYTAIVGDGLNGVIDDVRVYNRILTADEISEMYACEGVDTLYNGLVNRWLMREGGSGVVMSGSGVVKDIIGLKNGTPNGSPTFGESFLKTKSNTKWQ